MKTSTRIIIFILIFLSSICTGCIHSSRGNTMPGTDEEINKRIEEIRKKNATLVLVGENGDPLSHAKVTIEQTKHAFLFGCSFADYFNDVSPAFEKNFTAIFNFATLPIYWSAYNEKRVKRMAEWCLERRILVKAHPLIWHEVSPNWKAKNKEEADAIIKQRVTGVVSHFRGLIDMFDILNESLASSRFKNLVGNWVTGLGPVKAAERIYDWAKESNPGGLFLLNDYNVSADYVRQIKRLIKDGYVPAAVGVQSHMHTGIWSDQKIWETCERFRSTGIPVHFTEMTIVSANTRMIFDYSKQQKEWHSTEQGEMKQAKEVRRIYRLLFSHPSVEAITWWTYTDHGAWLAAPSGLFRKDMTPKPAYEELVQLIKSDWWTGPVDMETDGNGEVFFRGFMGDYRVLVDGREQNFRLDKGSADVMRIVF